ncbi:MAG TPA: MFS transporter [Thermoanaerobaculia bacterium]|nr:MFS transporter [Thermoanaerobaculia bacterium]
MNAQSRKIQRTYLLLLLLHTLAASFIWGINTLFLLDAGMSNAQAFAANAFFTLGMVLFEVPTGVVADTRGRRMSYLLGTLTLTISTLLYLWLWRISAPFWAWAVTSAFLGLGFTFFSGAFQAWLVDALKATGFDGPMEPVFAKGEIVEGVAMLGGSLAGGFLAQTFNLGVPYIVRAVILAITFVLAFLLMRDVGFTPERGKRPIEEVKRVLHGAVQHGLGNRPVRWIMLAAPFTDGLTIYAFYAMQPYLLQLYGDPHAYGIAGLAAAIVAGAQIAGGLAAPYLSRVFQRRTTVLLTATLVSAVILALIGLFPHFWTAVSLLVIWGLMFAAVVPVRQSYLNALIRSEQRATVLSFDSLLGSSGGVVIQPALGRAADVWGYPASYLASAAVQLLAAPFVWLARREQAPADAMSANGDDAKAI